MFRAVGLLEFAIALSAYCYYGDVFRTPSYGGQWKYLSYINLYVKLLYFCLCCNVTFFQLLHLRSYAAAINGFKDFIYASVYLRYCCAVYVSFWAVYFIDRELVHPTYLDDILPQWANHLLHTSILMIVFEVYFNHLSYPSRKVALFVCAFFELLYLAWVLWVREQSGIWVYSFLKRLKGSSLVVDVLAEIFVAWGTYLLGEYLNNNFVPYAKSKKASR